MALAQKDYARAVKTADESFERFDQMGFRVFRSDVLYLKAKALRLLGKADAAYPVFLHAKREAEQIGSRWMLWRILAALAEIEMQRGNHDQAKSLRAHARETIDYIAAHTPADPSTPLGTSLRAAFLNLPDVRAVMNPQ